MGCGFGVEPELGVDGRFVLRALQAITDGAGVLQQGAGLGEEFIACVIGSLPVVPLDALGDDGVLGCLVQAGDVGA